MNGSTINDRLLKNGQTVPLKNGDVIVFGQDQNSFIFAYAAPEITTLPPPLLDDKISLVPKSFPTYARIDHLASPQVLVNPKTVASNVIFSLITKKSFKQISSIVLLTQNR